jgi:hypothetical protein
MIIRPVEESDKPLLEKWIQAEPEHAATTPDWYFQKNTSAAFYGDEEGDVLVAKFTPCLRLDLEFNPQVSKERIRAVMKEGLASVVAGAQAKGFGELVFSSTVKRLVAFCKLLGFEPSPDYRKTI